MNTWIDKLSFAQRQRLQFIEAMLIWDGAVQRKDVCEVFNVTPNHLTRDIKRYRNLNEGALEYDVETRAYRQGAKFKPLLASGSSDEYLTLLQAYSASRSSSILPAMGHIVAAEGLPTPTGLVDTNVLKALVQAIRNGTGLSINYQSFRVPDPTMRTIWPHTLVYTGDRWHARAYDGLREDFRDFVLSRIYHAQPVSEVSPSRVDKDQLWNEFERIEIIPSEKLSASQKAVVEKEYGMKLSAEKKVWSVNLRKCLVGYFLYRHRLEFCSNIVGQSAGGMHPYLALSEPSLAAKYRFNRD